MARKITYDDFKKMPGVERIEGTMWNPQVGDSIVGVLKNITSVKKPQNPSEEIVTYWIDTSEKVMRINGTTVLDDLMGDGPEIGDAVGIKFTHEGRNLHNKNKPIKYFEVICKKKPKETEKPPVSEKVRNSDVAENATTENKEDKPTNSFNSRDNTEISEIVKGIEEDVEHSNDPITELNMFKMANKQLEYDKKTLELVNAEIRNRNYPKRG